MTTRTPSTTRTIVLAAAPIAVTIGAYGVIFGAAAREPLGAGGSFLASVVVFSGAVQFALVGLLIANASWTTIIVTALLLNVRHVVLGAALRPSIDAPVVKRLGLSWWMVDEACALALADPDTPRRTLFTTGAMFYGSWLIGTAIGLMTGSIGDVASIAEEVSPVLFIGLAALLARSRSSVIRCAITAVATFLGALALPGSRALVALVVATIVALPGGER